jgi:trehalose 6-phosphate phosphatase
MHWKDTTNTLLAPLVSMDRVGLVTDMDGTISRLADEPDAAFVTPTSRDLLERLAGQLALVAVVSGRSVADVREKVGLENVHYYGNHGLETWAGGQVRTAPEAAAFRPQMEAVLSGVRPLAEPGMFLQDKHATLSIHYRQTPDPAGARDRLQPHLARIAEDAGLNLFEGHMVFEVRPPIEIDKGSAFQALIRDHQLDAALFIGDDTTDAAALRMAARLRAEDRCYAVGVGVESDSTPDAVLESADVFAAGVSGVEALLAWLLEARMASST